LREGSGFFTRYHVRRTGFLGVEDRRVVLQLDADVVRALYRTAGRTLLLPCDDYLPLPLWKGSVRRHLPPGLSPPLERWTVVARVRAARRWWRLVHLVVFPHDRQWTTPLRQVDGLTQRTEGLLRDGRVAYCYRRRLAVAAEATLGSHRHGLVTTCRCSLRLAPCGFGLWRPFTYRLPPYLLSPFY